MISVIGRTDEGSVYGQYNFGEVREVYISRADSEPQGTEGDDSPERVTVAWDVKMRFHNLDGSTEIWHTKDQQEAEIVAITLADILIFRSPFFDGRRYVIEDCMKIWRTSYEKRMQKTQKVEGETEGVRQEEKANSHGQPSKTTSHDSLNENGKPKGD